MISITLPNIAIQKADNGWIVTYARKTTEEERKTSADKHRTVIAIAKNDKELLVVIKDAATAISALEVKTL